jgi:hypothetical protein
MPRRKPVPPADQPTAASPDPAVTPRPAAEAKTRVGFYMPPAQADEARGTYLWTRPHTGIKSFSDYIAAAVNEKAARDRETYNGGRSFGTVSAGELPTGRPVEV